MVYKRKEVKEEPKVEKKVEEPKKPEITEDNVIQEPPLAYEA